jgi:phosphoribosylanthranilate isomerase
MTKIKICGITNAGDARFCAEQGADFLGLIFVRSSPRYIEPEVAADIIARTQGVKFVGVFRDEPIDAVRGIAKKIGLDAVQLHGSESDDDVRAVGMPVIKAVRVESVLPRGSDAAEWIMFDSGGGTGRTFDWSLLAQYDRKRPFFLAGGITPENVVQAIEKVRPDAIDVSSGVEIEPGIKHLAKVRVLIERVRRG